MVAPVYYFDINKTATKKVHWKVLCRAPPLKLGHTKLESNPKSSEYKKSNPINPKFSLILHLKAYILEHKEVTGRHFCETSFQCVMLPHSFRTRWSVIPCQSSHLQWVYHMAATCEVVYSVTFLYSFEKSINEIKMNIYVYA